MLTAATFSLQAHWDYPEKTLHAFLADARDILDTPAQPRDTTSALVVSLHRQPASTNTRTPPNSNTPVIGIFHASFMLFAPP